MKKSTTGMLWMFGTKLTMTVISCLILRWGIVENDMPVGAEDVENGGEQSIEWVAHLNAAKNTNQIIVVAVDGTSAKLSMYIKDEDNVWKEYLETDAYIGKKGLGKVREGDGKTPIGVFRFTHAFGILENPGTDLDYVQVDESYYWVDDGASTYYNQFVSTESVKMDWASAEHICEYEDLYNYVLAINYNEDGIPGEGSAIFLHCTSQKTNSTSGCVAIPENIMKKILQKINEKCVLIIDTEKGVRNY